MSIHEVVRLCPICSKVELFGKVDMTGHEHKYICPQCNGRHYGEPEIDGPSYKCHKCDESSDQGSWKKTPLKESEKIQGPLSACAKCTSIIDKGNVALIETKDGTEGGEENRTGNVYFVTPSKAFLERIGDEKAVYVQASVIAKIKEQQSPEGGDNEDT